MIGIMGPSRSGKDEAAEILVNEFAFRYAGSTSVVISREIARRESITFEAAHAQRHARKGEWFRVGNEMRANDPAALVRELWPSTDIIVGVRSRGEMEAARDWFKIVFWIERDVPQDPTLEFGPEMCDVIVRNAFTLEHYLRMWRILGASLQAATSTRES